MGWRRYFIGGGTIVALVLAAIVLWLNHRSPHDRFVEELELVGFSTSMIGGPTAEKLNEALRESDRLCTSICTGNIPAGLAQIAGINWLYC
jgi:hypothetical protein